MIINAIRDKIREYSSMKKSAFTVAEVLIALVVLGVIASAVTGVVYFSKNGGEFQNRDLVATLQSQVIKLNRSYKIALTENDDLDRWVYRDAKGTLTKMSTQSTSAQQNSMFAKVWKTYASTTMDCGATTNGDCFPTATLNASNGASVDYNKDASYYKMRTADGAAVAIKVTDPLCRGTGATSRDRGVCGEIIVDINGNKGPNKAGLDTFRLGIFHDGIRAFNAGCNDPLNSASVVLTSGAPCSEDMNVKVCPKDAPQKCYNCAGEVVCVADQKACETLQKQEGCAKETCAKGTVSYYVDGKVQCIPEAQKECYEKIKLNPEFRWDPVKKACLEPDDNCTKNGGYWEASKGICWDSPEHMCQTKQMIYVAKPGQTPDFECITQETYCKRAIKDGGLGGWLWKNNVCCTATTPAANTNATCCNSYSVKDSSKKTWWDGSAACCTTENTEACCKSAENGHAAGFWSGGKCWKDPSTQCTKPKSEGGLGGIWIPSTSSCCTTKIVDDVNNPKFCFASEKDKCNAAKDKGGKGGWYVASADKCCINDTDDRVCCKGIWRSVNGKNYCYANEKDVCLAPTANAGKGGWWVPEATTYDEFAGCCTSTNSRACCNGKDKAHWWASASNSCCTGAIETTKACCESADNGHESKYWTSRPSQCWTSASQYCITASGSNGLGGWNWIGDAKNGVCCTDTAKSTRSNDSGNGEIRHQGQFDRQLTDTESKLCCINQSTLNGHSRFIWYTANFKGNSGYCWDTVNNLCQQQTGTSDDHGLGGWYWDGTDCCSINTESSSIKYWTKGNIKANPPTLESTAPVSIKNQSNRSTKSCCTNVNSKGGHDRFNWTDKNYQGKGGYCWFDDEELCQSQTANSGNDNGMGGWYWDKATSRCCTSKYDVDKNTNTKTQQVYRKGATGAQVKAYNQQNDSNLACCTNSNTKGGHTRFIWTAKAYADTRGYCWLNNNELCQAQTDDSSYNHDAGMGGWYWDSASNSCCTIRTASAQPINVKGGSASSVAVKNQSSNSNKNCCTNTNTKGGHDRFNWTDSTKVAGSKGYCWFNDSELCTNQVNGMGGWHWIPTGAGCCTNKYGEEDSTTTQQVYRKGATSAQVNTYNQKGASNKDCCTNPSTLGGHTRFNWTNSTQVSGSKGYCWFNDSELCTDKVNGMGGWAYDSSANRCCTSHYDVNVNTNTKTQQVYRKGGSRGASVSVYNQENDSNEFCCTNSNTSGGHGRFIWTAKTYNDTRGYCWATNEELCQAQTDNATYSKDHGMGGWYWDSASNSCCTIKTTTAQAVKTKGNVAGSVAVKNQSSNSNMACCINSNSKGGHDRFNWTNSTNVTGSKGYCWFNDSELCTNQVNGMGGWAWIATSSTEGYCCSVKYGEEASTTTQTVFRKTPKGRAPSSTPVSVKNQKGASDKACCTNSSTLGGHTRFNWTDNTNVVRSKGYCWLNDAEMCTDKTNGMGGWLWDSANNACCTIEYGKYDNTTTQVVYRKGGTSAKVSTKNQTGASSKACCTSSNTSGGHNRRIWIDNNYKNRGGYCWQTVSELCTTGTRGMGGWAWDSANNACCTINTTSNQTIYNGSTIASSVTVKNQSSNSTMQCCTNSSSNYGHDRKFWSSTTASHTAGYCWSGKEEYCKSTLAGKGLGGWAYISSGDVCCTDNSTTNRRYYNGSSYSTMNRKDQNTGSSEACCTNSSSINGHTRFNWINSRCWASQSEYCTTGTANSGAGGYHLDGTNCCTTAKTGTITVKGKGGSSSTITFKNNSSNSTEGCCKKYDGNPTRTLWLNNKCWETSGGTGTTASDAFCKGSNPGMGGWYNYDSGSTHYCCTTTTTQSVTGKLNGSSYTVTPIDQHDTKTCCNNLTGTRWYSTSAETGGSCCTNENSEICCTAPTRKVGSTTYHTKGTWVAKGTHSATANVCCHDKNASNACCKGMNNDSYWLAGGSCVNTDNSKAACESDNNPKGRGVWVASANVCCYNENASQTCCSAISPSKFWVNNACVACVDDSNKANCESTNNCTFQNGGGRGVWVAKGSQYTYTAMLSPETLNNKTLLAQSKSSLVASSIDDLKAYHDFVINYTPVPNWNSGNVALAAGFVTGYDCPDYNPNCHAPGNATQNIGCSLTFNKPEKNTYKTATLGVFSEGTHSNMLCTLEPSSIDKDATLECKTGYTAKIVATGGCSYDIHHESGASSAGTVHISTDGSPSKDSCTVTMSCTGANLNWNPGDFNIGCGSPITLSGTPQTTGSPVSEGCAGLKPDGDCYKFTGLKVTAKSTWTVSDHPDTPSCFNAHNAWVAIASGSAGGEPGTNEMDIHVKTGASGDCKFKVCNDKGAALGNCATVTISSSLNMSYEKNGTCQSGSGSGSDPDPGPGTSTYTVPSDTCCHSQQSSETCCHALCPSGSDCKWTNNSCKVSGCNNLTIATNPGASAVTVSTSGGCYKPNQTVSVTATAQSGYTFTGWTVSGGCTVSSATSATTTITMGSSACTVTANAAKEEISDVYGPCESCSQYMGASGCKSKDYYTTTTGGISCNRLQNQMPVTIESQNKQCCLTYTSTVKQCVSGVYCPNNLNDGSNPKTNINPCPHAVVPQNAAGHYLFTGPNKGNCYAHNANVKQCNKDAMFAPVPFSQNDLAAPAETPNGCVGGGSAYFLNNKNFDTSSTEYCANAPKTTTSYTADCTSNKYGTLVNIKAGTGVQSVSYSGKKRLWLGGKADISATMQSGYVFDSWSVSGSGCSYSTSAQSSKAVGMGCSTSGGCTCTLTAKGKDASIVTFKMYGKPTNASEAGIIQGSRYVLYAESTSSTGTVNINNGTIVARVKCKSAYYTPSINVYGTGCSMSGSKSDATYSGTVTASGGSTCEVYFYCSEPSTGGGGGGGGCGGPITDGSGNGGGSNKGSYHFRQNTIC